MVFLGIFHARQDNTGSPTKPRLFGSIQSIFKTTQSYAGDETTDRLLPAPKQRSQHWLKCCGSWRSWGSRRRAPAAAAYSVPCPGSCRNPSAGAGTSPPGPRRDHGHAGAEPRPMLGRAVLFLQESPRASRLCGGGCWGCLPGCSARSVAARTEGREKTMASSSWVNFISG